jgi:hypothetical protein
VNTSVQSTWDAPHVGLEKLLELSEKICLYGEVAPVQAWARLCERGGFKDLEVDALRALTKELLGEMRCNG